MPRLGERAAGAMFWNLLGKIAFMVVKYAESIVLVRLLGGDEYGALSGLININGMVVMLSALGLESTLLRYLPEAITRGGPQAERRLVARSLVTRLVLSLLAALALWLLAEPFARGILHDVARAGLVRITAVMVIGLGMQNLLARVLTARYEQKFINLTQVVSTAVYLLVAAAAVLAGAGVRGVLICMVVMYFALAVLYLWRLRREHPLADEARHDAAPTTWRRMIEFSSVIYIYSLLHFVLEKGMDVLLIGRLRTELVQVTWYVLAYNFAYYAVSFFSMAFAEGFTLAMVGEVAAKGDTEKLRRIFAVFVEYLYVFIVPIMVGGLLLGGDLLRLMYGTIGEGAVVPMLVLLVGMSLAKMGGVTANYLQALNRERVLVKARVIFGVVNFVLDVLLIPWLGALGAAIATSLATNGGVAYEWVVVHRELRPKYPWMFLVKVLAASLVMGGAIWWLGAYIAWRPLLRLPFLIFFGGAVFAAALVVLRPFRKEHIELLETLPLPFKNLWLKLLAPR